MLSYVEYSSVENYGRGDCVMMQIRHMEILRYIEQHNKAKCYQPGQIIFAQGNPANEFFYLKRGLAHVYTLTENGGERNIMIAWPGRFFGASTFFSARNRQSSAIALKESEVLWIDRSLYLACVERFPEFQQLLLEELSEDLTVMFEQLADSSLLEADVKVARFICRRLSASRQTEGTAPIVAYTQEVIADVLGLSRWSVNRVLSKFKENGWLRIERGKIVILEAEAIRRFAYETAGG